MTRLVWSAAQANCPPLSSWTGSPPPQGSLGSSQGSGSLENDQQESMEARLQNPVLPAHHRCSKEASHSLQGPDQNPLRVPKS